MTYTWDRDARLRVTCDAPGCGAVLNLDFHDSATPIADTVRDAGWAIRWTAAVEHCCPDHLSAPQRHHPEDSRGRAHN